MNNYKLNHSIFERKAIHVASELLGKYIVRKFEDGTIREFMITEVEAYGGEDDLACHASKGRTPRNSVMYEKGGLIYVYLVYSSNSSMSCGL